MKWLKILRWTFDAGWHSEVFKVLSEEGATEARRICLELKKYAVQDQRNCKLRSNSLETCHSKAP